MPDTLTDRTTVWPKGIDCYTIHTAFQKEWKQKRDKCHLLQSQLRPFGFNRSIFIIDLVSMISNNVLDTKVQILVLL